MKKSKDQDLVYGRIARELAEHSYIHTTEQCRARVKSLKTKHKQIVNQLRRSCVGCKLEEELEVPSDFLFFDYMDAVIGSRASVTPVHLLDSADTPGSSPSS